MPVILGSHTIRHAQPARRPWNVRAIVMMMISLLFVAGTVTTSSVLSASYASAAAACPAGSTLTVISSTNYCRIDYSYRSVSSPGGTNLSGSTTFTIPAGVSSITATLLGGHGMDAWNTDATHTYAVTPGGRGSSITATHTVVAGDVLTISTSQFGGFGGNGNCYTANRGDGGGYAKLTITGGDQVVAGGGGGAGCSGATFATYLGATALTMVAGAGGDAGLPAIDGGAVAVAATAGGASSTNYGGGGATVLAGGAGGAGLIAGAAGTSLNGANSPAGGSSSGGGGGGGYFGGGSGSTGGWNPPAGGGGGGSSFASGFTVTAASLSTSTVAAGSVSVLFQISIPVTYDTQGGSSTPSDTFWPGATATLPATPTKAGYSFNGWYSATSAGIRYGGASDSFSPPGSTALLLYAQWSLIQSSVAYDSQGGSSVSSGTYTYGSGMSLPSAPTKPGYTFAGWFEQAQSGSAVSSPYNPLATSAFTLYAQWTPNNYAVTYDSQGGSAVSAGNFAFGSSFSLAMAPTKTGYSFVDWYDAATSGTRLGSAGTSIAPGTAAALTAYAQWSAISSAITFNTQGGSSVSQGHYSYDTPVALPAAPTRTGYTFSGWYATSTAGSALSAPYNPLQTSDFTIFAQWAPNSYTLTYETDGGNAVSSSNFGFGTSVTLPSTPTKNGYAFAGWFTAPTGGTALGTSFTPQVAANQTVYARWDAIPATVVASQTLVHTGEPLGFVAELSVGFMLLGWLLAVVARLARRRH